MNDSTKPICDCGEMEKLRRQIDRLTKALREIRDANGPHGDTSMTRAMMRAIAGDALCADPRLHLTEVINPVKRAYYETHDPPHCPTCGCDRGPALCQHGFPLAENVCGPCSKGEPNRPPLKATPVRTPEVCGAPHGKCRCDDGSENGDEQL